MIVPRRAAAACSSALLVFIVCVATATVPDQTYTVNGSDTYQIGGHDVRSEIAYRGTQKLHIEQHSYGTTYLADVSYLRDDQGTREKVRASFESTIATNGEQRDGTNHDPDYLTILNQPFAVQLDAPTLHDLASLTGAVPFDFPSPMTGAPLHGILRHAGTGLLDGTRVVGVAFDATGPLHGALPDHPNLTLSGRIKMRGTAYYTLSNALLLSLDATLTISGNVDGAERGDRVEIEYRRTIRALPGTTLAKPHAESRSLGTKRETVAPAEPVMGS